MRQIAAGYRCQRPSTTVQRFRDWKKPSPKSAKNHVVKNLSNALHQVRETHKGISVSIIKYFTKCFSYAVHQNFGDAGGIRKNLTAIVPHAFGDHSQCDESWCTYLRNPDTYVHKSLPLGKDLQGEKPQEGLTKVFQTYVDNSDKLAKLGCTNGNENLNQMIAKKAPKIATLFRVS